jgi:hypothetical protein
VGLLEPADHGLLGAIVSGAVPDRLDVAQVREIDVYQGREEGLKERLQLRRDTCVR